MPPKKRLLHGATAATLVLAGLASLSLASLAGCGRDTLTGSAGAPRDLGPLTAQAVASGKPAVVGVAYKTKAQLDALAAGGMEIWFVDQENRRVYGQVDALAFETIGKLGLQARIVQGPGAFNHFDKGYRTYPQIVAELKDMAAKHPQIARFIDAGDSWEKTQGKADRDIVGLRIGNGDTASKPAVIFLGNHHAREIVTPEIVLHIAHLLVDGYGQDPEATFFVENRDIYLVPMVNPDGHKLASEGMDWRKNTNQSNGGGPVRPPNGPGTDLNRNYGFQWGGTGASPVAGNATYRGAGPFSEPETQAVKRLVESRKFTFLMTYHSFSNLILWPWGHTNAAPPDPRLPAIGKKLGALSGYKPQQSIDLYATHGDTTDWAFGEHGILSYTTEIGSWGDGFDPVFSKMPKFWKENEPGARLLLNLADDPGHAFGPELAEVTAQGGQIRVATAKGAAAAEYFVGKPGRDGSGQALPLSGARAAASLPRVAPGTLVLAHAKNAKGVWGPWKATFAR